MGLLMLLYMIPLHTQRKRLKNSQVKRKDAKETEKGKETGSKMVFENINIELQSLKIYRMQNSEAK